MKDLQTLKPSLDTGAPLRGWELLPLGLLFAVRVGILASLPFEGLTGYGDYPHFYDLAEFAVRGGGGMPYLEHWIEFPPLFPYLSLLIYYLAGGVEHVYVYLLGFLMTLFDVGSLWIVMQLAARIGPRDWATNVGWLYFGYLSLPAFGWWTFDPISVFFLLLALLSVIMARPILAGIASGIGALTKFLPLLALLVAWRFRPARQWALATGMAAGILLLGISPFLLANSEMALAALRAQAAKGSWETVWALVDGNYGTGNFGELEEYLDPERATQRRGNPSRIPHGLPTVAFAALGLWVYTRLDRDNEKLALPFFTLTWCVLFLWSRGWSPQWLSYLMPLILLSLPLRRSVIYGLNLVLVSLLEWPLLLSRGRFDLIWLPVVLRTMLLILLALDVGSLVLRGRKRLGGEVGVANL